MSTKQYAIYVRSDGKVEVLDQVVDGCCAYSHEPLETAKVRMATCGYTLEVVDSRQRGNAREPATSLSQ